VLSKVLKYSKEIDQSAIYRLVNNINVTKELYLEAVRKNGGAFYFVPKELRDREICLEAVKQDRWILRFVPDELKEYVKQSLGIQ
jgi:hypothetical protein